MARRPSLLVLIKGLGLGGAERLIVEAADYWNRDLFDYHVAYVLPWKDAFVPRLRDLGITPLPIGSRRGFGPATVVQLRRLLSEHDVNLIHAHLPATGILARLTTRVPVVYTEHNIASSYRMPTRLLNRLTYRMNTTVTAVSSEVATSLTGYGVEPIVITNGVSANRDPEEARGARAELELPETIPLVVHIGNIRPHKGHQTLVSVARELKAMGSNAFIASIGVEKTPGTLDSLRRRTSELSLDNLRFLGPKTNARAYIEAADVLVNPSDVEGLPIAILEAMALGTPVVATAVGGVPEVVQHGVTGLLAPPSEPRMLAMRVIDLLTDTTRRAALSENAARMIAERFGMEEMVKAFESIYAQVLSDTIHPDS